MVIDEQNKFGPRNNFGQFEIPGASNQFAGDIDINSGGIELNLQDVIGNKTNDIDAYDREIKSILNVVDDVGIAIASTHQGHDDAKGLGKHEVVMSGDMPDGAVIHKSMGVLNENELHFNVSNNRTK